MTERTFGSVCSGIEAATLAFGPLGWRASWLSEIDPFASAVLAHHYPDVPNFGDMTLLAQMVRQGLIHAPDMLCGGTPCQSFSLAGRRLSLADARGNLTLAFCDLADAIDEQRSKPCTVFWENVPGVLSTEDNAFGCFLAELAGEGRALEPCERPEAGRNSRYWKWRNGAHVPRWPNAGAVVGPRRTVAWRTLDAQFFGLAQRRRRVFVIASADPGLDPLSILFEFDGVRRDSEPSRGPGQEAAPTIMAGSPNGGPGHGARSGYSKDNLIVPVAFGGNRTGGPIDVAPALLAHPSFKCDFETETLIAFDTTQVTSPANVSNPKPGDPCHPLMAHGHPPTIAFNARRNPISSPLDTPGNTNAVAWAIGSHAGAAGGDQANRSHASGGPVGSNISEECAYSLRGGRTQGVAFAMQVRRLMPVECERLQGFPDGYTQVPYRGKPAADGPRYKAIGNSWAVPCVAWIAKRLTA